MTLPEAVEVCKKRNGTPHEWDWELAEAAEVVVKELKLLQMVIVQSFFSEHNEVLSENDPRNVSELLANAKLSVDAPAMLGLLREIIEYTKNDSMVFPAVSTILSIRKMVAKHT